MKIKVIFNKNAKEKHINFNFARDQFSEKNIRKEAKRLVKERMPHNIDNISKIEWEY